MPTDTPNAYEFDDAQIVNLRRFMGYGAYGSGNVGAYSARYFTDYGWLEYRIRNLTQAEGSVVANVYLKQIAQCETEIFGARSNLDTDMVAVWTHNKQEMQDRYAEFTRLRIRLCAFFDVPPGGDLAKATGGRRWGM